MRTNIDIDDALMAAAQEATGLPTKRAVVEEGLRTLVRLREQQGIRALRGRIRFAEEPPEGGEQAVQDAAAGDRVLVPDRPRKTGKGVLARTLTIKGRAPRARGKAEGAAGDDRGERRHR